MNNSNIPANKKCGKLGTICVNLVCNLQDCCIWWRHHTGFRQLHLRSHEETNLSLFTSGLSCFCQIATTDIVSSLIRIVYVCHGLIIKQKQRQTNTIVIHNFQLHHHSARHAFLAKELANP